MKFKFALAILAGAITALAQTNSPVSMKGNMEIAYGTRESAKPVEGKVDLYRLDLNFANSVVWRGTITNTPTIFSSVLGREIQKGRLDYLIAVAVANPANPSQTRNVGRLVGTVPIDKAGIYRFQDGDAKLAIETVGKMQGFERKLGGLAIGKPPKLDSVLGSVKKNALSVTKMVRGKNVSVVVKDYDKMTFNGHTTAGGPAGIYPAVTVSGDMVYDYERSVWYFTGLTMNYSIDGKSVTDRLSGNIRWVESPTRASDGMGEYQFDIRVNEPEAKGSEAEAFAPAGDESSFFEVDPGLKALVGTMNYVDTKSGDRVVRSMVTIDLLGQGGLNKTQAMALFNLIFQSAVVPINAE